MSSIPIALQLYSVRKECEQNFPGTLESVAKMGYEGVEFAGYYGRSADELRKMLDDNGLKCAGTHIALETLLGDAFLETVAFNKTLGNTFLIVPGLSKEYTVSRAAWQKVAELFNGISERARAEGMFVGYHNHFHEFTELDGELPMDTFFGATRHEVVMQFDTGNALHGGGDARDFLRKYPGRALTVHLKEYAEGWDKALIGEGDVPWKDIFELCETLGGTRWYVVEQESYAFPPMECVDKCLQNLRGMGK